MVNPTERREALPTPFFASDVSAFPLDPTLMTSSELMFFFGAPLAHVVQYEERLRTRRLWKPLSRREAAGSFRMLLAEA
jgi:hypothetical protein